MPDLVNRPAYEASAARLLSSTLERQRRELAVVGVERAAELPESDWRRYSDELVVAYLLLLAGPWSQSYYGLAGRYSVFTSGREIDQAYRRWAEGRAAAEADRIVRGTREIVNKAAENVRELRRLIGGSGGAGGAPLSPLPQAPGGSAGLTVEIRTRIEAAQQLYPVSDVRRSTLYGVSAVTDATSAGEQAVRDVFDRMERTGGPVGVGRKLKLKPYWVTERDGRVCKICRPLDGQPESVWVGRFPSGPKAHDLCRCYLRWEVE